MSSFTNRSVSFSRRSFVEKFGLGMGAALMAPLARNLIREAQGQANDRKIAMFWFACNGINPYWVFTPKEFAEPLNGINQQEPIEVSNSSLINSASYTLPDAFKPLEASYRNNLLMMEGFKNYPRKGEDVGHGAGWIALTCVPSTDLVDQSQPGGISFDQHLANSISAAAPRKSVLIAISSKIDQVMKSHMFGTAANQSVPAFQSPVELFRDLFPNMPAPVTMGSTPSSRNRVIFDGLRYDIARLEKEFAAPEKDKLAAYLGIVEEYEKRLQGASNLSCNGGTAPTLTQTGDPVDVMVGLNALASIAVVCGMTNVMGVDIGCRDSHDFGPNLQSILRASVKGVEGTSLADVGHQDAPVNGPVITDTYAWISGMVAKTLDSLKAIPQGNGTVFDSTVAMITSDNGETHHSGQGRWPLVLVGGKPGGLNLDGRYLRYPSDPAHSLADVYLSIGQGFGVPAGDFAKGTDGLGPNYGKNGEAGVPPGPLAELI